MADITEITRDLEARVDELRAGAEELQRIEAALQILRGPRRHAGSARDRVLQAVADQPGLTTSELARSAGVSPASAHSALKALLEDGAVRRDDTKRWSVA